jgi:hypothetical protein
MAVNTFTGAIDSNWGTAGNWSLGSVPTATADTVTFDAASPACNASAANYVAYDLDMSGYLNTWTLNTRVFNVSRHITLGSGMTIVQTTGELRSYTTGGVAATLISNGCYVPSFVISGVNSHTVTLGDDWNVGKLQTFLSTNIALTINGNKIYINTWWQLNTTAHNILGTTTFEFTGGANCLWGGSGANGPGIRNPIIINKSGGTLTFGPYIYLNTGCILTHTSGAISSTGTTIVNATTTTFNTSSGVTFNQLNVTGNQTLNSTLYANTIQIVTACGFLGNYGFITDVLQTQQQSGTYTLTSTNTYLVNNEIYLNSRFDSNCFFVSSIPSSKAILTFNGLNSQQVIFNVDFTDIDCSGGNKLWSLNGIITTSDNIERSYSQIPPMTITYFG